MGASIVDIRNMGDALRNTGYKNIESAVSEIIDNSVEANAKDIFVIQGEFGSTFTLVDFALKKGLIPLYATTRRIAKETRNGETVHREYVFEHVCFKKYDYFKEL